MSIIYQFFISFIWIFPDRIFMYGFLHGIRKLDGKKHHENNEIRRRSLIIWA